MSKHETIPDIIRNAIQKDERTAYRLAIDSGVNQAVIGRFIRGERDLNLRTADKLCQALGLVLTPAKKGRQ